jgi:hypothetical protein
MSLEREHKRGQTVGETLSLRVLILPAEKKKGKST